MMDQNKPGSSRSWMWFIVAVLLYGVVVSTFNGFTNTDLREAIRDQEAPRNEDTGLENVEQFAAVLADGSHDDNTCWFQNTELFNETVKIVYPDYDPETKVVGQWDQDTNTISLMQPNGLTVQTVAHEVSHMVDTFMAQQPTIAPHYEAYMQGFWTWCVYEIMQHDIACAEDPWCNIE